jgi:dGTPase
MDDPTSRRTDDREDESRRPESRRDRDRIYYSDAFRRLEEVTQVVSISSSTSHNRLTHSLRVEQVASSILYSLKHRFADNPHIGELNPDVISAACLAHDIGHPPFGHVGEVALHRVALCGEHRKEQNKYEGASASQRPDGACRKCDCPDGFEGNAQTLRVLTVLEQGGRYVAFRNATGGVSPDQSYGLNLTRATLSASCKYPWRRLEDGRKKHKWGAYDCDENILEWVFGGMASDQTPESQIMDWADDVAYCIHDLEDFYRLGAIPLAQLKDYSSESWRVLLDYIDADIQRKASETDRTSLLSQLCVEIRNLRSSGEKVPRVEGTKKNKKREDFWKKYPNLAVLHADIMASWPNKRFKGGLHDVAAIARFRSRLVSTLIRAATIDADGQIVISDQGRMTAEFLKRVVWFYVIDSSTFVTMNHGQRVAVEGTYNFMRERLHDITGWKKMPTAGQMRDLPGRLVDYILVAQACKPGLGKYNSVRQTLCRSILDYLASLSDEEMYELWGHLSGLNSASRLSAAFDW